MCFFLCTTRQTMAFYLSCPERISVLTYISHISFNISIETCSYTCTRLWKKFTHYKRRYLWNFFLVSFVTATEFPTSVPNINFFTGSYVYWTVHHLDSWVKRNQLDATYFIILFNAQHVSDVNTTILRSLRLIRSYFMGCVWFGVCWRSASVWLWWCGVFMQSEALRASDCIKTPHHHSHTEAERQHTPNQTQPMK